MGYNIKKGRLCGLVWSCSKCSKTLASLSEKQLKQWIRQHNLTHKPKGKDSRRRV